MSTIKYKRKLIGVEVKLGFMYIPAKGQDALPSSNVSTTSKIKVSLSGEERDLNYNSEHNRVFGLTGWYREKSLKEGSIVKVEIRDQTIYVSPTEIEKTTKEQLIKGETPITNIDVSNLSSGAKGNIVEDRIKELVLLLGQGLLNVYKPVIDNEGIDLIVLKNGQFHSLFLQVKSRYNAFIKKKFELTISKTFKPHPNYFIVGVSFNPSKMEVEDKILFVSSKVVAEQATLLKDGTLRITASLKANSKDQWQPYLVSKEEMIERLFDKFAILEEHIV